MQKRPLPPPEALEALLKGFEDGGINSEQRRWLRTRAYPNASDLNLKLRIAIIYVQSLHRLPYREWCDETGEEKIVEEHRIAYGFAVKMLQELPRPYWKKLFQVMVEEAQKSRITIDGFRQVYQGLKHSTKPRDKAACKLLRMWDEKVRETE